MTDGREWSAMPHHRSEADGFRACIYGPFGADPATDEMLQVLVARLGDTRLALAAADPARVPDCCGAEVTDLHDLRAVESALRASDVALWLGGEVPDTSSTELGWMSDLLVGKSPPELAATHLALLRGVPVCALNLTVRCSPDALRAQPAWLEALLGMAIIAVPDTASYDALTAVVGDDTLLVHADLRLASDRTEDSSGDRPGSTSGWIAARSSALLDELASALCGTPEQSSRMGVNLAADRPRLRRALRPQEAQLRVAEAQARAAARIAVAEARARAAVAGARRPAAGLGEISGQLHAQSERATAAETALAQVRAEYEAVTHSTAWKVGSMLSSLWSRLRMRRHPRAGG